MNDPGKMMPELIEEISVLKERIRELKQSQDEYRRTEKVLRQREKTLQAFFDAVHESMVLISTDGTVLLSNEVGARRLGRSVPELLGTCLYDHFPPEVAKFRKEQYEKVVATGGPVYFQDTRLGRVFEQYCYPLVDDGGKVSGVTIFAHEITERKRSLEALEESEERYRMVVEHSRDGIAIIEDDVHIYVNKKFLDIFGMDSTGEILGKTCSVTTHPDDLERVMGIRNMRKHNKDAPSAYEFKGIRKDGSTIFIDVSAIKMTYKGKDVILAFLRDITERKRGEEALRASEARYRSIFENAIEGIFQTTPEGRYLSINRAFAKMFGYGSPEEMMAHVTDIGEQLYVNPADRRRLREMLSGTGYIEGFEAEVRRKDGTTFWISINAYCVRDGDGSLLYFEGTNTDITDRKQAQDALRKSEYALHAEKDKFQTISENAPFGMVLIDKRGNFTYSNPAFRDMFGYDLSEVPNGRTWFSRAYPDTAYRHSVISTWAEEFSTLTPGERKKKTFTVTCKNGSQKIINFIPLRLFSGDYLMTCEDVTEIKHLEAQLRQSQKMEAIGTLAGGVAHDFNNILTTIIGYGSILQMDMDDEDPRKQYLDQILTSSQKAANLTQSLLAFSRKQVIELKAHSINTIIAGIEKLLRRLLTEDIDFKVVPASPDVTIMADMTQIDQVLMNLAANARDAMPKGGRLVISVEGVDIDSSFAEIHGFDGSGGFALITVTDTGSGMDEKTREKIFEPFFTTKELGRGTGLGLAIVYGIVKQHNGYINVYSEPGHGTVFKIYLPAVKAEPEQLRKVSRNIKGGKETILLAEDNNELRSLTKEVLLRRGYTVVEAIDGDDAVNRFMENKDVIDLLILDVVMPKKNGKEAYEEIRKFRKDMRAIFTSGYTGDIVRVKDIGDEAVDFISKPLTPDDLLLKVREVLDK